MTKKTKRTLSTLALLLTIAANALVPTAAHATQLKRETMDAGEAPYITIQAHNCRINIELLDSGSTECVYDAEKLAFAKETILDNHLLTIASNSGKAVDAAATIYMTRTAYEGITITGTNIALFIDSGFECNYEAILLDSRASIRYTASPVSTSYNYNLLLSNSVCDFAIDAQADNYTIIADTHKGQGGSLSLPAGESWLVRTDGKHQYPLNEHGASITVDLSDNSTFNVAFVRNAN